MIIDKRSENSVYITMGKWVYYFDDGIEGEETLTRWQEDQQDGSYYKSPEKWTLVEPPVKFLDERNQKLIEHLEDLFEQADEDTPLECRSQSFTDALRDAEELLIKLGRRVKE